MKNFSAQSVHTDPRSEHRGIPQHNVPGKHVASEKQCVSYWAEHIANVLRSPLHHFLESVHRKLEVFTRHTEWGKISVFPYLKKSYQFLWVYLISCFHKCYQSLKSSSSCSVFIGQSFPPCVYVWRLSRYHPRAHVEHACRRVHAHTQFSLQGWHPNVYRS